MNPLGNNRVSDALLSLYCIINVIEGIYAFIANMNFLIYKKYWNLWTYDLKNGVHKKLNGNFVELGNK